jgi:hypothetical protein
MVVIGMNEDERYKCEMDGFEESEGESEKEKC